MNFDYVKFCRLVFELHVGSSAHIASVFPPVRDLGEAVRPLVRPV